MKRWECLNIPLFMQKLIFGPVQGSNRLGGQFEVQFEIILWQTEIRETYEDTVEICELQ